jgi:ssDNA-specific exonuclease RecJ
MKVALKRDIMGALYTDGKADKQKLIAKLCLDTGFQEKTISKVMQHMEELGYITIQGGVVTRVGPKPKPECDAKAEV